MSQLIVLYMYQLLAKHYHHLYFLSTNLPTPSYSEVLSDFWLFETADSGFIDTDLFCKWFEQVCLKSCGKDARVCSSWMSICPVFQAEWCEFIAIENGIDIPYSTSHSSQLLQTLDVGYSHVLKAKVCEIMTGLGFPVTKTLPWHLFPKVSHQYEQKLNRHLLLLPFQPQGYSHTMDLLLRPACKNNNIQSTSGNKYVKKDVSVQTCL